MTNKHMWFWFRLLESDFSVIRSRGWSYVYLLYLSRYFTNISSVSSHRWVSEWPSREGKVPLLLYAWVELRKGIWKIFFFSFHFFFISLVSCSLTVLYRPASQVPQHYTISGQATWLHARGRPEECEAYPQFMLHSPQIGSLAFNLSPHIRCKTGVRCNCASAIKGLTNRQGKIRP